jgi:hypothetical protein
MIAGKGIPESTGYPFSFRKHQIGSKALVGLTSILPFSLTRRIFYIKKFAYQYEGVLKTKASKRPGAFFVIHP